MTIPTEANREKAREIIRFSQAAAHPHALEINIAQALDAAVPNLRDIAERAAQQLAKDDALTVSEMTESIYKVLAVPQDDLRSRMRKVLLMVSAFGNSVCVCDVLSRDQHDDECLFARALWDDLQGDPDTTNPNKDTNGTMSSDRR